MAEELILLPVRIGVRVTRFALRTGVHATGQAVAVATDVVKSLAGGGLGAQDRAAPPPAREPEPERRVPEPEPERRVPEPQPERRAPDAPPPPVLDADEVIEPDAVAEPEPIHVSAEPELVEEVAEPGAEEGAGAEVTVAEPWDGYRQMKADDLIERMRVATSAELAAVQLYESAHRKRETVLAAARRELRAADNTK